MSDDLAAYALLGLGLLAVAVVLALPVLAVWWLVGRPRPVPGTPPPVTTARPGAELEPADDAAAPTTVLPGERVLRRCEACGVLWKGAPGDDVSVAVLRLRRWMRRRTREKKTDTPSWARRRGWSRCPSCLSTDVRTSRAQRTGR